MLRVYDTAKARGHTNYILPFVRVNVLKLAFFSEEPRRVW